MSSTRTLTKIIAMILCFVIALTCLTACGGSSASSDEVLSQNGDKPGTVIEETDEYVTIVDQAGREVTAKKNPETIALCYRVIIRFLLNLEQGDKIVGVGKSEKFLDELEPNLANAVDVGKGVADVEAVAELNPDIFLHKASDVETLDAIQDLGIPSVGIRVENQEDMVTAFEIMGKICGKEDKAKELIDFYNSHIEKCQSLTKDIENKKSAIVMGSSIGKVADGSMLQGNMIEIAGGINCADELKATELWPTAGAEQIFAWNPDYIFITNQEGAVYDADDILNDPAWSEITAVKNKDVYVMPAKEDSWELPGIVSVIGIEYMIRTMYPDLLSDEELEKDVNDLYELSYGKTFERDELGY